MTDPLAAIAAPEEATLERLRADLARRAERDGLLDVAYRQLDSPLGSLLLAATAAGVVRIAFAGEGHDAVLDELTTTLSPRLLHAPARLDTVARQLEQYFAGTRRAFDDVAVDLQSVSGFRRAVLTHLRDIPFGATESYATVARAAGSPNAVRAAGTACAMNPVPLVVPCHRVVRGDGTIGQYRGGVEAKRVLLALEAVRERRTRALAWAGVAATLDEVGCAVAGRVLDDQQCADVAAMYDDDARFRSTIDMSRYRFGKGEYRYFAEPLPEVVTGLRAAFWPHLLTVARDWAVRTGRRAPWPDAFDDWLTMCHDAGQDRPTPLLLRYGPGDWNALHRDLYGDLVFPLQVVVGLDEPGEDYEGGEFVVVEQRPRAQSRATVTVIRRGEALVLTTRDRPVRSSRGWAMAPVRHGVSVVRAGRRRTLGLVFHDAR